MAVDFVALREKLLGNAPLGRTVEYVHSYTPSLLFPVSRAVGRSHFSQEAQNLCCDGEEVWTGYELSWLSANGKPQVAIARFVFPASSSHLVESKSLKLYLNSFNQTVFSSWEVVRSTMQRDLSSVVGSDVEVEFYSLEQYASMQKKIPSGESLDHLEPAKILYRPAAEFLKVGQRSSEGEYYTHLFKSHCLATGQPDWATASVHYVGPHIRPDALLAYLLSYRNHSGFAEHCVEQIFLDLLTRCGPEKLSVSLYFTRRGGIDISAIRSNEGRRIDRRVKDCRQ